MRLAVEVEVQKGHKEIAELALQQMLNAAKAWADCPTGKRTLDAELQTEFLALTCAFLAACQEGKRR
jgi:hypothetical protein